MPRCPLYKLLHIAKCKILKQQEGTKDTEKWWKKSSDNLRTETGTLVSAYSDLQ